MEVLPQERRTIGSFIYRHPESSATDLSSGQMENRKTDKIRGLMHPRKIHTNQHLVV